ncbi:MAG: hypothetical protein ABII00_11450 [Elusimicrobiota bacterium]
MACARCEKPIEPGRGNFYVIRIDAVSDPTPPVITEEELSRDVGKEVERLTALMRDKSDQELVDQVYRRLFLCLCAACYGRWIEDPAGRSRG